MIGQSPLNEPVAAGRWNERWHVAGLCLVLAAITFAVFGQTLHYDIINLDDGSYVYDNPVVVRGLTLKTMVWAFTHVECHLYHPLTMLSLMVDDQLHGLHAGGFHLTNVLLHTASVVLLFLILRQMTGALWRSAFVAAVFAIHPLRVESVAWVAERKDVLGTFFFMLTLGAYARYVRKPNSPARYLMVVAAFALALLSKPTMVMLPFVLLLLDYWPLQRAESAGRLILEKIPLLALAAAACAITILAAGKGVASLANVPMSSRLGNALVSYAVYLRQMIWPEGLALFYPYPPNGQPAWAVILAGMVLAGFLAVAFWRRRKQPWILVGWFWYLGMLTPMIGLVQVGAFAHADRFTYLPQIGIYVAVTWLAAEWGAKLHMGRVATGSLMAAVLSALTICAWQQTTCWKDVETLWNHTLACTTRNDVAHYNLAQALLQKGKINEAMDQFQKSLDINPNSVEANYNLGNALCQTGKLDEGIKHFKQALQINPDYAEAQISLGNALCQTGKLDEGIVHFKQALQTNPGIAATHYNLGLALLQKGNAGDAIDHLQKALQLAPANPRVQTKLAWILATCPEASLRDGPKAVELARQASALTGAKDPIVLHTLAAAFAETGSFSDAKASVQKAIELALAAGQQHLAEQLNDELHRYETGLPLHQ